MKRLVWAVVVGFVIPFLYSIIVAPLTLYIKDNSTLDLLLMVPVRWPILILFWLGAVPFESERAMFLYIIGCNVVFYTLLNYVLFWGLSKRKSGRGEAPPDPPIFVQQ